MIEKILVCIEGSPSSQRAIDLALRIAREQRAELAGLAVIDEPDRDRTLLEDAATHARKWLAVFLERCRAAGVSASTFEERARPAAAILQHMPEFALTFIGRDANFNFETALEDTNTRDAILRVGSKPVVVVPDCAPVDSARLMVAFDGSSAAERAVRSLAHSGLAQSSEVHVVSVDDDGGDACEMASRGVRLLEELGVKAAPLNVVTALPVAEALLESRDRLGARMLAMGAYTRSRLAEALWGSVTRTLTEKTRVPLFLHH